MPRRVFKQGDRVIYCKSKCTTHPGRRARDVFAAANGDTYVYSVEKCWVVVDVRIDGTLLLQTRRGKTHLIEPNDPKLRRATLWDRLRYRSQFRHLQLTDSDIRTTEPLRS